MLHSIGNAEEFHKFVEELSDNIINTLEAYHNALPSEEVRDYIREQRKELNEIYKLHDSRYEYYCEIQETLMKPDGDTWTLRHLFQNPIACKGNIYYYTSY